MIYELSNSDYEKARPLFRALEFHLSSAAVLDGNNPGGETGIRERTQLYNV